MRRKDSFWLPSPVAGGWSQVFFLALSTGSSWRWEEEKKELGIYDSFLEELGFFPFEERP